MAEDNETHEFGTCCETLRKAMYEVPSPFFAVSEGDSVLYLAVGYTKTKEGNTAWFDSTVMFCPFCGAQLQTKEEVAAKARNDD